MPRLDRTEAKEGLEGASNHKQRRKDTNLCANEIGEGTAILYVSRGAIQTSSEQTTTDDECGVADTSETAHESHPSTVVHERRKGESIRGEAIQSTQSLPLTGVCLSIRPTAHL